MFFETLMKLIFGHAVFDLAFQNAYIAKMKSPWTQRLPEESPWWMVMTAHSLINGAGVYLITGILWLGILETVIHFIIDFWSCTRFISHLEDQFLHLLSKILWASVYFSFIS